MVLCCALLLLVLCCALVLMVVSQGMFVVLLDCVLLLCL